MSQSKIRLLLALLIVMLGVCTSGAFAQSFDAVPTVLAFDKEAKPLATKYKVAYVVQCVNNPYCEAGVKGMTDAAKKFGFELKIFDSNFNVGEQLKKVQNAVTNGFDGYVFTPLAAASGCNMYKNILKPTGKPVVTVGTMMCGDKDYTAGTAAAVIMATQDYYNKFVDKAFDECPGKCVAAAVGGYVGSDLFTIWETALATAAKKHPNVKLVVDQPGNFNPQMALRVVQDALSAHPDINLVISSWDDMSRGVVQAVVNANKVPGKDVRIISAGATKDAVDRVKRGEINMTGIYLPYEEAYYAGAAMAMALSGNPPNGFIDEAKLPQVIGGPKTVYLTKENASKFDPKY
ncbi:sugar ABC transporter substrate-binding protein [Paraburkholderia sp. SIMBA_049]